MNFDEFFKKYKQITVECPFNTDPGDTFYYSEQEHLKSNLLVQKCIELDISSAFPTICTYAFGKEHQFVQKIFSFEDKFERNKFIAISMTHNEQLINEIGGNGLKILNSYCKIISLGYIYNNFADITIIEYKKDGAIFTGTLKYDKDDEFNSFIEKTIGIRFHIDLINNYIRFNKTSVFDYLNKGIIIKGNYKDCPDYLKDIILPSIFNGEFFNGELIETVKKIYSPLYYQILYRGELYSEIGYYYKFKNRWIQPNGELNMNIAEPKYILYNFIYPIIAILKNT